MNDLPHRHLSRPVWHQTRPGNTLLQFEDPATYDGRYHSAGARGAWYASLTERGAWAQLFRHWGQHEIALDGESTLVIFPDGMAKVVAEHSRVQRPPAPDARRAHAHPRTGRPDRLRRPLYDALAALGQLRRR